MPFFFAHNYPNAKIIVLEPDHVNFKALTKNISGYRNIVALEVGAWWREAQLQVINPDAKSWSFQFEEVVTGGIPCVTIKNLIDKYAGEGETMVKIDIEGAEKEIFSRSPDWLNSVSVVQLEIHHCWKQVFDALSNFDYRASISGENIIIDLTPDES